MKKVYIDADSLVYRAAHLSTVDNTLEEAESIAESEAEEISLPTETNSISHLDMMMGIFNSMVEDIMGHVSVLETIDPEPVIVITVKPSVYPKAEPNFRYAIMASVSDEAVKGYKENRKGMEVPAGLDDLYRAVHKMPNTLCVSGVEADDVVVYYGRQKGTIVCALDKDVLGSLEEAFNYNTMDWSASDPEDIKRFPFFQTITGDSSDGLRGVYRMGAKKAEQILMGMTDEAEMWKAVLEAYESKGQTKEEALATMRCVRMDQWSPEKGLELWNGLE